MTISEFRNTIAANFRKLREGETVQVGNLWLRGYTFDPDDEDFGPLCAKCRNKADYSTDYEDEQVFICDTCIREVYHGKLYSDFLKNLTIL